MTLQVVIDSGIFLATVIQDSRSPKAIDLLRQWEVSQTRLFAPVLFHYELSAMLRKHVHRGSLVEADANRWLESLTRRPVTLIYDTALIRRAYILATELNQSTG